MTEVSTRIAALSANLDKAHLRFEKLRTDNDTLKKRVDELESRLRRDTERLDILQLAYDKMKMAKSIAGKVSEKAEMKHRVNELVREIDKCIALLNR